MKDCFSTYHPVVNLVYFALVLGCAMFLLHPLCLMISLLCGAGYALCLNGKKAAGLCLKGILPMMVFTAVLNPIFSHEGVTILTWLPSGNPLTLESVLYGLAAAGMLGGVVLWFSCSSAVITSDKFVYLFGRVIPALSLVLSMALRFVPRFTQQLKVVTRAQKCIGRDPSRGSLFHRVRCAGAILKIMISWALENGIDTADSMKSRGYGLPGRTAFSVYRFDRRDGQALAVIALLGGIVLAGAAFDGLTWRYFPSVKWSTAPLSLCVLAAYAALCALPIILNRKEERKWKALRSKI